MEEDQEGFLNRRASSAVFNPADATNTDLNQNAGDSKPTDSKRYLQQPLTAHQMMGVGNNNAPADDDSEEEMESENEDNGEN